MTTTQLNLASAAAIAIEPITFVLDPASNTTITRLADGWHNSTTETVYPFDSYTGMFYTRQWQQIEDAKTALFLTFAEESGAANSEPFEYETPWGVVVLP